MFLYYLIAALSVVLYLHGFFPIPAATSLTTNFSNDPPLPAKFQKAVVVVIDALRLDFISKENTPFLWSTYQEAGCFIRLKVETPTVTLPRIKAMISGGVPQFIDIILNLASPTVLEDSLIHRAHARNRSIVFYGDDIWLKLFPEQFMRSEGTSSFFVHDYTEVDDNVTRNVHQENVRSDWDIMILHYLGLDHIGHVYGPKSSLILTKLLEMDSVIKEIYESTMQKNEPTLLVVTGDHGMRDSGGHGGSTFPETNVPMVILGMPCKNSSFSQTDIPANLAVLLGVDIPATSIGQLQLNILSHLPLSDYLRALRYNSFVLKTKIDTCGEHLETAEHFHNSFLLNNIEELGNSAVKLYEDCSKQMSEELQIKSTQQNVASLVIASVTAVCVLFAIVQNLQGVHCQHSKLEQLLMLVVLTLQFLNKSMVVTLPLVVIAFLMCLRRLFCFKMKCFMDVDFKFLLIMSMIHPFSFLSSSYLEEEHQFWYFFTGTYFLLQCWENKFVSWIALFTVIRIVRTLNQVGDKWAASPDLADWLMEPDNVFFLHLVFCSGLALSYYCNVMLSKNKVNVIMDGVIFLLILVCKIAAANAVLGKILWVLILVKFVWCTLQKEGFLPVWIVIITLLLKPYNVILLPICVLSGQFLQKALREDDQVLIHLWLGNLFFFAQGHDNSLASVDISSGYVGLNEYVPSLVIPQVLCHTYAFPVLTHLLLFRYKPTHIAQYISMFVMQRLYVVVLVFVVTFLHRNHLFIWSVFAPKMFVEASHFIFLFVEVCCYCMSQFINKRLL